MKNPALGIAPKGHHSVTDFSWFNQSYMILDSGQYVSSPTSLTVPGYQDPAKIAVALLDYPGTVGIPYGRVSTWLRMNHAYSYPDIYWRNQDSPPVYIPQNSYCLTVYQTGWVVRRKTPGFYFTIGSGSWGGTWALNTWYQIRVSFWPKLVPPNPDQQYIKVEKEDAGIWTQYGSTLTDTGNTWVSSLTSRMGVGVYNWKGYQCWFDDTTFYVYVP